MLKMSLNRIRLDLRIEPVTPLLVKSGDKGATLLYPELPDLMFVRTGPRGNETVYIPGSSLKGVVRSACERVLRSVDKYCCDPMNPKNDCHDKASRMGDEVARRGAPGTPHPQAPVYRTVCYACRTFGCQALASHTLFEDAYPPEADRVRTNETERRNGVSIDRRTGGPAPGRLFDLEAVSGGAFETQIHLHNIQLWQLGLLGIVLREIDEGFVRIGSAKSRGFGHVRLRPKGLVFDLTDVAHAVKAPTGIAGVRRDLAQPYDLIEGDSLATQVGGDRMETAFGVRWTWTGDLAWSLLDACARDPWAAFCKTARREGAD